jgi:flagellar biosynthesis protein FlhG
LKLIAGGSGVRSLLAVGPKKMAMFVEQLQVLAPDTDVLLFDTGAGIHSKVVPFFKLADETILVTTPDPSAVSDAYATAKTVYRSNESARVRILVNMADSEEEAQAVYSALKSTCEKFLGVAPTYLGFVRQDAAVGQAAKMRVPFILNDISAAASDLRSVAKSVQGMVGSRPAKGKHKTAA